MSEPSSPARADVVIVDDAPDNLHLLIELLTGQGHRVRAFPDGPSALRAVQRRRPGLVLLDVAMPGMDGYEVCRRLRADPRTREVPVLFLSAREDAADKVRAFESGGLDFVTKPFQPAEVLARVALQLDLARRRAALAESYRTLQGLEEARDALTHMVAHDIRSPLWGVDVALGAAVEALAGREAAVRRTLERARGSVAEALGLVSTMLELSRLQQDRMPLHLREFDLAALSREVVRDLSARAGRRRLAVRGGPRLTVRADPEVVRRVLANLVGNAVKFTGDDGRIAVSLAADGGTVRVEVEDDGIGVAETDQARLFSGQAPRVEAGGTRGFGLGLAFVGVAVAAHGGAVGVRSRPGAGSTFWFTLPLPAPLSP
jgi:signal transduction histidine kinase